MIKIKKDFRIKPASLKKRVFSLLPSFIIFLIGFLSCWSVIRFTRDYAEVILKDSLIARTKILGSALDLSDIHHVIHKDPVAMGPAYDRLKYHLNRGVRVDPRFRFAYLFYQNGDRIAFLADSELEGSEESSPFGQAYDEASPALKRLFVDADAFVEGPLSDRWGVWISALVPIFDEDGKTRIAVLGVDVNDKIWNQYVNSYLFFAYTICGLLAFILFFVLVFYYQQGSMIDKLHYSEERFREISDGSGDWIWEADKERLFTYCSNGVKKILGYAPQEIVGQKRICDLYFPEDRDAVRKDLSALSGQERDHAHEIARCQHKDGHEVYLDVKRYPIYGKKDVVLGYRGIYRDVTELFMKNRIIERHQRALERVNQDLRASELELIKAVKDTKDMNRRLVEAQDELIQAEKIAGIALLASGVAHEIKNPLSIIMQSVERIEKNIPASGDPNTPYIKMLKNAVVRANKVVNSLTNLSRTSQLEQTIFDIHEAGASALDLIDPKVKSANVILKREFYGQPILVKGDRVLLEQVFYDILDNAVDATAAQGQITMSFFLKKDVSNDKKADRVIIEIKDTGEGISQENIAKVFDPFFTTKEPGRGTGLGLSTAYLILERHFGDIKVISQEGVGTTFTISLPVTG